MLLQYVFFFASVVLNAAQSIGRSSNVELIPSSVVLNSTSSAEFQCINHRPNGVPLDVQLSKNISRKQLRLSIDPLNETMINIRLQFSDYVGTFQLFCHEKEQRRRGTRADVAVKTELGFIRLVKRCEVHERQHIKCLFQAPNIARAIQNGFSANFEFSESNGQPVYRKTDEILTKESTGKYLTFQWTPLIDGQFPDGVRMTMKISLVHFDTSYYHFDMTPIFLIKPHFIIQKVSNKHIQIQLTPSSPPADCERSSISKSDSTLNRTWTPIPSNSTVIIINNLPYQVCLRCRQTLLDPFGTEECQEIALPNRIFKDNISKIIIVILWLIILIGIGLIYFLCVKKVKTTVHSPVNKEIYELVVIIDEDDREKYTSLDQAGFSDNTNDLDLKKYSSMYKK